MFFLEREKPILKDIFDNTRNYLICGTLFAVGVWFQRGAPGLLQPVSKEPASYYVGHFVGAVFIFVGAILTLLNIGQTYAMVVPTYFEALDGVRNWADKSKHKRLAKFVKDTLDVTEEGVSLIVVLGLFLLILYFVVTLYKSSRIG